jgi:hypothetical protein
MSYNFVWCGYALDGIYFCLRPIYCNPSLSSCSWVADDPLDVILTQSYVVHDYPRCDSIFYFVCVFYARRKCYVVFACCFVFVLHAVIRSWFETTCELMWLALYLYSCLCVYYFCLHSNIIGSAVQYSAVFQESRSCCSIGVTEPQRVMRNGLGEMT